MENSFAPVAGSALMSSYDLQEGVAALSRGAYFKEAPFDMMLSILSESAARMSGVARVGIWALIEEHRELRCLELYELSIGRHSKGCSIRAGQYPIFFRAMRAGSGIMADDAYTHPLTAEFAVDYLPRHGVTAMLGTPIHIRGELQGVLSLEQVGTHQSWSPAHALFAQAIANLIALGLVEGEADEARRLAREADLRLKAVLGI